MRNLPGLTPAWIITLAALMAFLVGLGGEAFSRGLYDFLKDFQTAIVGAAAFSLAYWAARPVFGQMNETRRQAAILTYEMLRQSYASLAEEEGALSAGLSKLLTAELFETSLDNITSVDILDFWSTELKNDAINIRQLAKEYENFRLQPSGMESIRNGRIQVRARLMLLYLQQEEAHRLIVKISEQRHAKAGQDWSETQAELGSIKFSSQATGAANSIRQLKGQISKEMKRIAVLLDESYAQISTK